jgi:hypothetical protein
MPKFQFCLPREGNLTRIQLRAIDNKVPISIFVYNPFSKKMALICFIKRLLNLKYVNKKGLLIVESEFLKFIIKEKLEDSQSVRRYNFNRFTRTYIFKWSSWYW